jgi:HD-like signal output (HDOD) protein
MNTGLLYLPEFSDPQNFGKAPAPNSTKSTQRLTVRERVISALRTRGDVPALPVTAHKLLSLAKDPHADLDAIAEVARLDPGITSRVLKVASSPVFGGQTLTNIQDALMMIGMEEMKRIATSLSVIESFRHMRVRVNWELFWLHSLLTARLLEILVNAFRDTTGPEYMAGLLHDVGKIFFEHNFPQEFDMVMMRALASREGMYPEESRLLDITHAEVSALLCNKWHLSHEVIGAVQFHHEPSSPLNHDPNDPSYSPFLSYCLCVADKLVNMCGANMEGAEDLNGTSVESMPEWVWLQRFQAVRPLTLDVAAEAKRAQEVISALKTSAGGKPAGGFASRK